MNKRLSKADRKILVDSLKSVKGGHTRAVLEELGVPWPLKKGWRKRFINQGRIQAKNKSKVNSASPHRSFSGNNFYSSREWQALRYRVIAKYGRECMCCGWKPGCAEDQGPIHVDHIEPRSKRPDLQLEFSNMQILCRVCNLGKSNKDNTDFRPKPSDEEVEPEPHWMDAAFSSTIQ